MTSKLTQVPRIDLHVDIRLSEAEIRALDALAGYGTDAFLKVFYAQMGQHYMQPHEAGLRSLFEAIRRDLAPILRRQDAARKAFVLQDPVIRSRKEHDEMVARLTSQGATA